MYLLLNVKHFLGKIIFPNVNHFLGQRKYNLDYILYLVISYSDLSVFYIWGKIYCVGVRYADWIKSGRYPHTPYLVDGGVESYYLFINSCSIIEKTNT